MSSAAREELLELVRALPDDQVDEATEYIEALNGGDPFSNMDPEERKRLHAALEKGRAQIEAGMCSPAEEVIARMRAIRESR